LAGSLPDALREELNNAERERRRLEDEIRALEVQIGTPAFASLRFPSQER
jgi:hypothetical protein